MGIKHFWQWYKKNFGKDIKTLGKDKTFRNVNVVVDNLMIDLNGIFHASTQKIYEYGTYKPKMSLMGKNIKKKNIRSFKTQVKVFEDICKNIEKILFIVNPQKRLVLCVDGPAPLSKQMQQRSRRFRAAMDRKDGDFDSNNLTPGTKFMDSLTKYIDWYIIKNISTNPSWRNIEVIFSSEKAVGEGEHKIINYMRSYGCKNDSYCIHGLDADLIMLALGTHLPNFWILREDMYDPRNEFFILDIGETRKKLANLMNWETNSGTNGSFDPMCAVTDFIFMCFMVGNDFLPHVPSLEIIEGGIDHMIDIYKSIGEKYGHLTKYVSRGENKECKSSIKSDSDIVFQKVPLEVFFGTIAQYDKGILEDKLIKKDKFFPDLLLENNSKFNKDTNKFELDIEKYRDSYYKNNFEDNTDIKELCHQYLVGLQWVLSYYTRGVPDWKWCFKHHYAPFAHEISEYISEFKHSEKKETIPTTPFQQLLSVLPPKSAGIIPIPLSQLLTDSRSEIKKLCPDKFAVDISGKRKEWEGIVLLPVVNFDIISKEYFKHIGKVSREDLERNIRGESLLYCFNPDISFEYLSHYGNISNCRVKFVNIEL
jgi:5'-3' exonuclease